MTKTKLEQAVSDLRDGELRVWMQLHELPGICFRGTKSSLAKKIAGGRSRAAIHDSIQGLEAKRYILVEKAHKVGWKISLLRRLDVSVGAYAKF